MINVVASKIDADEREEVPLSTAGAYAKKIDAGFHQTSAKDGTGIEILFTSIAEKLYIKRLAGENEGPREKSDTIVVTPKNHNPIVLEPSAENNPGGQ